MKKKQKVIESDYMSFNELMEYLPGFTPRYVRFLVATEQIPHIKPTPRKLVFKKTDLDAWLAARTVQVD